MMAARMRRLDPNSEIGLMPMPEPCADLPSHLVAQEPGQLGRLGRVGLSLQPGVDVLGVLTEDDHVDLLGVEHRRGNSGEPPHRPEADVEVENLPQGDIEGADPTTDGSGQGSFDPDQVGAECLDGLLWQPVPGLVERLLAGQHLLPRHRLAVLGGGGVEHQLGRRPDIHSGSVTFDEGDDRLVGDMESAVGALGDEIGHAAAAYRHPSHLSPTEAPPAGPGDAPDQAVVLPGRSRIRARRVPGRSRSPGWPWIG